jgi:hypothetical protein
MTFDFQQSPEAGMDSFTLTFFDIDQNIIDFIVSMFIIILERIKKEVRDEKIVINIYYFYFSYCYPTDNDTGYLDAY